MLESDFLRCVEPEDWQTSFIDNVNSERTKIEFALCSDNSNIHDDCLNEEELIKWFSENDLKISWGMIQYKIDFESPEKPFFKELDFLGEDRVVLGKYIDRVTTLRKSSVDFHDSLFDPFRQETESFEYLSLL